MNSVLPAIILLFSTLYPSFMTSAPTVNAAETPNVVISEVAWMGTNKSYSDEWIELYNNSASDVVLDGWQLNSADGAPAITLSGTLPANGYFLLEKTDDQSVTEIQADHVYSGSLGNTVEHLKLIDASGAVIDEVDSWYAGDNTAKATMERIDPGVSGLDSTNWATANANYADGVGTPKSFNSTGADGSEIGRAHV